MENNSNSIDKRLTDNYGSYLRRKADISDFEDPLLPILQKFKEKYFVPDISSQKEATWLRIEKKLQDSIKIHHLNKSRVIQRWVVAATVLIASIVGAYLFYDQSKPILVLESYVTIDSVQLKDGTTVTLRPYSKLYELESSNHLQSYRIKGEGYFEVFRNEKRKFSVITDDGKITVLGTKFNISSWGSETRVFLEEGSINFEELNTNENVILSSGQSVETTGNSLILLNENADAREFSDWRNGQLFFTDELLGSIINEIEQQFNITVQIPDKLSLIALSGGLRLQSPEQSLQYLSLTLDGSFKKVSKSNYRFVPNSDQD